MKVKRNLLIIGALLFSSTAFSAKWKKIENKKSVFSKLFKQVNFHEFVYVLKSKDEAEPIINSLKQMTYIARYKEWGEYSVPNAVAITESENDSFDILKSDPTRQEPAPVEDEELEALKEFVEKNKVEVYEGVDGNDFGDCSNIYFLHKKSQQVALMSVCYSE